MKSKYTKYVDEEGKFFYDVVLPTGETLSKTPQSVGDYIHKLEQQERSYSEEDLRKALLDITLINPAHLSLLKSGYGQFPDTYEITEKGVDYIIEQFKKK